MEKEHQPDSMATITMKTEYSPSEVYSTSEPPPAYHKRGSNSVQIARIIALTVVASSFILGSFILASSWVSARASCHQLEQLDAMLDKELALEGRAYGNDGLLPDEPLPIANAHALHAAPPQPLQATESASAPAQVSQTPAAASHTKEDALTQAESKIDEDKLQKIDEPHTKHDIPNSDSDESSDSDSSAEEDDDLEGLRPMFKLPIQFDLDEIAGAFLANNQKGRMNCVVERRHEEPMERRFPFNILGAFAPRASHAERVAIICHGGDEPRPMNGFPEPQSQVFAFPLSGPVRLPIRPQPEQRPSGPAPGAEPRMPQFSPMNQHRSAPFPLPMPWDSSEEHMGGAPREMRIHVQRVIAIPAPHNMPPPPENMSPFAPPPPPPQQQPQDQAQQPAVMHQFVPQQAPVQELEQPEVQKMSTPQMHLPWGLTPEDMQVIHRAAEDAAAAQGRDQHQLDNDMQEVKTILVNKLAEAEAEDEDDKKAMEQFGGFRTLMLPQEVNPDDRRPHYVQPRSVRSVDAVLHREKRIKRSYSCSCK